VTVEQEQVLKNAVETKKKSEARVADLEDKLKNSKSVRERELKQAQNEVEQAKKRFDQSITKTKDKEQVRAELCAWVYDTESAGCRVLYLVQLKAVHTALWPHCPDKNVFGNRLNWPYDSHIVWDWVADCSWLVAKVIFLWFLATNIY